MNKPIYSWQIFTTSFLLYGTLSDNIVVIFIMGIATLIVTGYNVAKERDNIDTDILEEIFIFMQKEGELRSTSRHPRISASPPAKRSVRKTATRKKKVSSRRASRPAKRKT